MQNENLLLKRSNAVGGFGKPIDMGDVYFQVRASLKGDAEIAANEVVMTDLGVQTPSNLRPNPPRA